MKKLLSYLLFLFLLVIAFFFYGTQSSIDSQSYNNIKNYDLQQTNLNDTLTIMSYNIGWLSGMTNNLAVDRDDKLYSTNLNKGVKILDKNRPNIIAFQEIDIDANRSFNYNQPDSVANKLRYKHGALAINWDKKYVPFPGYNPKYFFSKTISSQYILSDFEIIENSSEKLIKPINAPFYYNAFYLDRLIQKTILKTKKGKLMVLNVHLEAFDEETRINHIKRSIEVFENYKDKMPTILIGDFNSPQDDNGIRNEILENLFSMDNVSNAIIDSVYKSNKNKYNTFPTDNPQTKIDFIFYNSDKIKAIDSGVMQELGEVSDHYPVWMKFVLID
jgi:endonuclease/exonuclease/phosphatase family metal-dependent hydrolase